MVELKEHINVNNKGVPISDLYFQASQIQSDCEDFNVSNVSVKNMRFDPNYCSIKFISDEGETRNSPLYRYALSQLCSKLGVPVNYIEKCINKGMLDLASDNINSWLEDFGKNLYIREYKGKVRGVLSDKFSLLDTPDIVKALSNTIDPNQYHVKGSYMSHERFHARIVQKEKMNINGEELFAGVQVDSSDVGRSNLIVSYFIYRQVCSNGLCIAQGGGNLFQQKHIGISSEEFMSGLKNGLSNIAVLTDKAEEFILFSKKKKLEIGNFKDKDSSSVKAFLETLRYKTKLSEEGADKVIELLTTTYEPTKWGLINAITQHSQEYTLERRIELEQIAGNMLFGVA